MSSTNRKIKQLIINKGTNLENETNKKINDPEEKKYTIQKVNLIYYEKIIKLLNEKGIKTGYISSPTAQEHLSKNEIEMLREINTTVIKTHPNVAPIQPELFLYKLDLFLDTSSHLKKDAATMFTQQIAKEFNRYYR